MKNLILILSLFISCHNNVLAQLNEVKVNDKGSIVLDENSELNSHYTLNLSEFEFDSDQKAIEYFNGLNTEYVIYRPTLYQGTVQIYLQLKKKPDWTLADWNEYFEKHKMDSIETIRKPSK